MVPVKEWWGNAEGDFRSQRVLEGEKRLADMY
jgi:hypothetical protein